MGLFKKSVAKPSNEPAPVPAAAPVTEWQQTLVAVEDGSAPEPFPEIPPVAEAPSSEFHDSLTSVSEPLAPEPAPQEAPIDFAPLELPPAQPDAPDASPLPRDLEPFVRREGNTLILKQPFLSPEAKRDLEDRLDPGRGGRFVERRWIPHRRESLREIELAVDAFDSKSRYEPKAVAWMRENTAERYRTLHSLERVPANIVGKRIVYETAHGFLVEVAYKEFGVIHHKYFSMPRTGSRPKTLRSLESGSYAHATIISPHLVDLITRVHRRTTPKGR